MITQQHILKLFIAYNRICIQTKIRIKNTRKKYSEFDTVCRFFEQIWHLLTILFIHLTHNKTEPYSSAWICACTYLPDGDGMSALTNDTYIPFNQDELGCVPKTLTEFREIVESDDVNKFEYSKMIRSKIKTATKSIADDDKYRIIIAKIHPFATVIKPPKQIEQDEFPKNVHLSSVRFLEVEYSCHDLPPVTIEIPSSHYVVDNQLLSKTYVLRYLEHLPMYSNWIFNEKTYKVKIIDHDSNMATITGNQYILLEKDEYRVMNISPMLGSKSSNTGKLSLANPLILGEEETKEPTKKTD